MRVSLIACLSVKLPLSVDGEQMLSRLAVLAILSLSK